MQKENQITDPKDIIKVMLESYGMSFCVPVNYNEYDELNDWLNKHMTGYYIIEGYPTSEFSGVVFVENRPDATNVKLKWG